MALPWQNAYSPISSRMPPWSVQSLTALKDLQFIKCPHFSGTRPQAVLSHDASAIYGATAIYLLHAA